MLPCAGKGDDHAHPPIHPTKLLNKIDCTKMGMNSFCFVRNSEYKS